MDASHTTEVQVIGEADRRALEAEAAERAAAAAKARTTRKPQPAKGEADKTSDPEGD